MYVRIQALGDPATLNIKPKEIRAVRFEYLADEARTSIIIEHHPNPKPDIKVSGPVALVAWWDEMIKTDIDNPDDAAVLADACEEHGLHEWAEKLREFQPILIHFQKIIACGGKKEC